MLHTLVCTCGSATNTCAYNAIYIHVASQAGRPYPVVKFMNARWVCVYMCKCLCVNLRVNKFSPEPWLLWISNVEIWTSIVGSRHSKTLEMFSQNERIFRVSSSSDSVH